MKVVCPNCHKEYELPENFSGHNLGCGDCLTVFPIVGTMGKGEAENSGEKKRYLPEEKTLLSITPCYRAYLLTFPGLIWLITVVPLLLYLPYLWIRVHSKRYTITNNRIITCEGWIAQRQWEILIDDIRGIELTQSFYERLIGVGHLTIGTAATADAEIFIDHIAHPKEVLALINEHRR